MNKRSSTRLMALLVAMIMLFNIAPVAAFAEGTPSGGSDKVGLGRENGYLIIGDEAFGTQTPPDDKKTFDVQFVVRGKYTYSGNNLVIAKYENVYGQVSAYEDGKPSTCNIDDEVSPKWDGKTKTIFVKPQTCDVELRYMIIVDIGGKDYAKTFIDFQNSEAGLANDEYLYSADFLKEFTGLAGDNFRLKTLENGKSITKIEPITVPDTYLHFNKPVYAVKKSDHSEQTRPFSLTYYGYNYGTEASNDLSIITTGVDEIPWEFGQDKICLYFRLAPSDSVPTNTVTGSSNTPTPTPTETVSEQPSESPSEQPSESPSEQPSAPAIKFIYNPASSDANDNVTVENFIEADDNGSEMWTQYAGRGRHEFHANDRNSLEYSITDLIAGHKYVFTLQTAYGIDVSTLTGYTADPNANFAGNTRTKVIITAPASGTAIIYINEAGATPITPEPSNTPAPVTHTVTYNYSGEVPTGAPSAPDEATYEVGATVPAAAVPTMEGYTFSGWTGEVETMPDANVSVTGSWTINSHKVTYSYTGDVPTGAPAVPAEASYEYGATVPAAAVPTLEGYTFSGWEGEVETMPDEDVEVTGSWTIHNNSVTYRYTGNVPATAAAVPAVANYDFGANVEIAAAPADVEGYTFEGWSE